MRIKLCLVIPTLVQGGAEKQLTLLATQLDPTQYDVHVIVLTHTGPYEKILRERGISLHFINKRGKFDPLAWRRLVKLLRKLRPQIVHTWLFAANSYGRSAAARVKVPVIIAGERSVDPWKSRWQFAVDRFLQKYTQAILTNTSAIVDFYASRGIDRNLFHIIPNAMADIPAISELSGDATNPPQTQPLTRHQVFQRLGLPTRSRLVGAVGRLWAQKGYRDLIWAAELLRVAYEDVLFVIVGDGPELKKLQEYRDHAGAIDAVRFVGHRSDARELMTGFDVLWNGSLYEGQSNTILEAMSQGLAVVASDIPGNRDLVIHGQTGYLVPLGDVNRLARITLELLRDDSARQRLGNQARLRIAEAFSLDQMIASHATFYQRLLEQRN